MVAGLSWEPDTRPDRDVDGLTNHDDWCPSEPEDPDGFEDTDGCPDDAVAARFDVRGPDGQRVDARITLDGAEHLTLEPGDPVFQAHPGDYAVTVTSEGYGPWTGTVRLNAAQGQVLDVPMSPLPGT
jgi:hypothetical protein